MVPPRRRLLRKVSSAAVSTGLPATPRRRLGRVLTMDSVASSPLIRLSTEAERLEAARLQAVGDSVAEEWDMEAGCVVAGAGAALSGVAVASPVLRRVRSKSRPRSPGASSPVSPARASLRRQAEEVRRAWDPSVPDTARCLARVHVRRVCFRQCTRPPKSGRFCDGHKDHVPFGVVGRCVPDNVSAEVVSLASQFRGVAAPSRKRAHGTTARPGSVSALLKRQRGEGEGSLLFGQVFSRWEGPGKPTQAGSPV